MRLASISIPLTRRLVALLVSLVVMIATPFAAAQSTIEVIPLSFRSAEDMVPLIKPLLDPGESVSGMSSQLILKASPQRIQEIQYLVKQFDTRPQMVTLSVRQGRGRLSTRQGLEVDRSFRLADDGSLDRNTSYRVIQNQRSDNLDQSFTVSTVEGRPALIELGRSVPIGQSYLAFTPFGVSQVDTVQYYDLASGFYAVPRLSGQQVTVEIHPRLENVDRRRQGSFEKAGAMTTVTGSLGQWIMVGGSSQTRGASRDGNSVSTRRTGDDAYSIWVKVDSR